MYVSFLGYTFVLRLSWYGGLNDCRTQLFLARVYLALYDVLCHACHKTNTKTTRSVHSCYVLKCSYGSSSPSSS